MSRLPFTGGGRSGATGDAPMTVSQAAVLIEQAVRAGTPPKVRIRGEISGVRERSHYYFTLKDDGAAISAVMFASSARRSGASIRDGDAVIATGRVEYYAKTGRISLIVDKIEPIGAGGLEARLRAMVEELKALGWLDDAAKQPLPIMPRRVAIITSKTGAALQDFIDTARRRCPAVSLLVVDARMQGDRAAGEVAAAVRTVNARAHELGVDVIVLTRGGGSLEDLWAFNERVVAEAVHGSVLPVVAAIGHEVDTTVAELVADLRCATPTQAAMRTVPDKAELARQLEAIGARMHATLRGRVAFGRQRTAALARRSAIARPRSIVTVRQERIGTIEATLAAAMRRNVEAEHRRLSGLTLALERGRPVVQQARRAAHLDDLAERLERVARRAIAARRGRVEAIASGMPRVIRRRAVSAEQRVVSLARELAAISPLAVLDRGYSVTLGPDGRAVRTPQDVTAGDAIVTRLADGSLRSVVGAGDGGQRAVRRKPRPSSEPASGLPGDGVPQMDLFDSGG